MIRSPKRHRITKEDSEENILRAYATGPNRLQTTEPTSGGAVTAVTNCSANCDEPARPQQWRPDLPFFGHASHADPFGWLVLLLIIAGDVETNPGLTNTHKQIWICDICHKQIHARKHISINCNRIEHWVHIRCGDIRQAQYTYTWNCHLCHLHRESKTHTDITPPLILSTLLYSAETWTVYRRHLKKIHAFMMRHLRSIMKIRWQDKLTNIKVLNRAGLPSMEDLLIRKNLHWTGHLLRMPTDCLPRQVLYSQLPDGQRPHGRPRLLYKDTIKRNLKKTDIDTNSWKSLALQ